MDFVVKESKFGKGVFADKDFSKGDMICFLKGKRMGLEILQSLKKRRRDILVDPLQISHDTYINLEEPFIYVNHSCEPNAGIRGTNELFAIMDIKKGDELSFDYSTTIDEGVDCQCNSKHCRGKIVDFFGLPEHLQKKYIALGAVPDFIKKKVKG